MELKARRAGRMALRMGGAALLITTCFGCGPGFSPEGGDRLWSPWKGGHGFHAKDFPEHILTRVDERVKVLNLTEAQKKEYAAIRIKVKAQLTAGREDRRRLMTGIRKEMEKDQPDIHQVAAALSLHLETLPGTIDRFMGLFLEFYETLDDGQKAEVIRSIRAHMKRMPSQAALEDPGDYADQAFLSRPLLSPVAGRR